MSYDWGPRYIIPSSVITTYSGNVRLREEFDEELLRKELRELGFSGSIARVNNPWYYRKKDNTTWIKIGESSDMGENFPVTWSTQNLENGQYEVMGLMHIYVKANGMEKAIARQNVVEVTVKN